jgi:hypothetical protein
MSFSLEDIKLINTGKVDSRKKVTAGNPVVTHSVLNMERTYCVMCLKPHGWVTQESFEFIRVHNVICICDDCTFSMGELALQPALINEVDIKL